MTGSHYEERAPVAGLARYVSCVWFQNVPTDGLPHMQRIVPDGCVDAIWCDGELMLAGPDTGPRLARLAPGSALVGIRLRPGAAPLLLGDVPASALRDTTVDMRELWGGSAGHLVEQLHVTCGGQAAADVLQGAVAARMAGFRPDPVVETVVALLGGCDPAPVAALAAAVGLSERQLRRRVTEAVGYSPKTLEGILRFRHAVTHGRGNPDRRRPRLAEVAVAAGYADQSHLTREVRRLAGITPRTLLG